MMMFPGRADGQLVEWVRPPSLAGCLLGPEMLAGRAVAVWLAPQGPSCRARRQLLCSHRLFLFSASSLKAS